MYLQNLGRKGCEKAGKLYKQSDLLEEEVKV